MNSIKVQVNNKTYSMKLYKTESSDGYCFHVIMDGKNQTVCGPVNKYTNGVELEHGEDLPRYLCGNCHHNLLINYGITESMIRSAYLAM